MNQIGVRAREFAKDLELLPRYDPEAEILEVSSPAVRAWPYGVDIDGAIAFDIDADRILANLDILAPPRAWSATETLGIPRPSRKGCLEFSDAAIRHKSFHLPLEFRTNKERNRLLVWFGDPDRVSEAIEMSSRCLALVAGRDLTGFFIDFS